MASASVADLGDGAPFTLLGDGRAVDTLGSLGRFRANGPIAAHPTFRMHRIPPGVVLANAGCSQPDTRGHYLIPKLLSLVTGLEAGLVYSPPIEAIRLCRINRWAKVSLLGLKTPIWVHTVAWKGSSSSSGRAMRKDFNRTMDSRRQVFRS